MGVMLGRNSRAPQPSPKITPVLPHGFCRVELRKARAPRLQQRRSSVACALRPPVHELYVDESKHDYVPHQTRDASDYVGMSLINDTKVRTFPGLSLEKYAGEHVKLHFRLM